MNQFYVEVIVDNLIDLLVQIEIFSKPVFFRFNSEVE